MKNVIVLLTSILFLACGSAKVVSTEPSNIPEVAERHKSTTDAVTETPALAKLKSDIETSMNFLASDDLEGRATGSAGIEKAAVFIENYLKSNQIKPYFETYRDSFNLENAVGYNIVGVVEGHDPKLKDEFVILGGHYDHIGFGKEVNGDKIANGANDDASGTIAAMEFAKYFAQSNTNKRSILVTLYSAEEMGLKGSSHLAKRLKDAGLNAYTMINFEMLGVPFTDNRGYDVFLSGFELSNML